MGVRAEEEVKRSCVTIRYNTMQYTQYSELFAHAVDVVVKRNCDSDSEKS